MSASSEAACATFSLKALLAPLSTEVFFDRHWGQRPVHLTSERACLPAPHLAMAREGVESLVRRSSGAVSLSRREGGRSVDGGQVGADAALAYYRANEQATLYLVRLDQGLPEFGALAARLAEGLGISREGGTAVVSMFASRRGGGFDFHFDKNENFAFQIAGTKRWRMAPNRHVQRPTANFEEDPLGELALYGGNRLEVPSEWEEVDLEPGQALYMPRGYWHETQALTEESMSIGFTFVSVTWADAVLPYVRRLLLRQEGWRAHARLDRSESGTSELKALLVDLPRSLGGLEDELCLSPPGHVEQSGVDDRYRNNRLASVQVEGFRGGTRSACVVSPTFAQMQSGRFSVSEAQELALSFIARRSVFTLAELIAETACDEASLRQLLDCLAETGAVRRLPPAGVAG